MKPAIRLSSIQYSKAPSTPKITSSQVATEASAGANMALAYREIGINWSTLKGGALALNVFYSTEEFVSCCLPNQSIEHSIIGGIDAPYVHIPFCLLRNTTY